MNDEELDGFDYVSFLGTITTIDGPPSSPPPPRTFPFGFALPHRDELDDLLDEVMEGL